MVYEVMLQMGPIHNIHVPRDRVTQIHQGFGFVEYRSVADAEYAANVMNGVKLYGKSLRVNKASADKQKTADIGAELFVGNLDPSVDEKLLYDTFSRFGPLLSLPKVAREDSGASKGFAFVSFGDFDSSDAAVATLNGQYILSKEVSVQYAFKKDGKGERHGDDAERALAAEAKKRNIVPEAQAIPQAFLNVGAPAAAAAVPTPPPVAPNGFAPPPGQMPLGAAPPGFAPPPARGPSPYGAHAQHAPPPASGPPGGRGSAPLQPPPAGLPARPPPGQPGYHGGDFNAGGYRAAPGSQPPPGFPGAPPPGYPAAPPGFQGPPGGAPPGAPPGFMPPGFQQPPPGFPRR